MSESGCLNDGNFHNLGAGHSVFREDVKIDKNLVVDGNLDVNGTMTTLNTVNTVVKDALIKLGQGDTTITKDLGLIFTRGNAVGTLTDQANKGLMWDANENEFAFIECNTEDGTSRAGTVNAGTVAIDAYAPLKCGTLAVTGISTLTGALNANGGIACDTNKFTVADTSGNVATAGTLAVTGISTLTGALNANGGIACDNNKFTVADTSGCLLYTSPSPRDGLLSRMPSSA